MLNPTAFYACLNILHVLSRGRHDLPNSRSDLAMLGPCWLYVALFSLVAASNIKIALTGGTHSKNCGFQAFSRTEDRPKSALGTRLGLS